MLDESAHAKNTGLAHRSRPLLIIRVCRSLLSNHILPPPYSDQDTEDLSPDDGTKIWKCDSCC